MNDGTVKSINQRVEELEASQLKSNQILERLKIDSQLFIKKGSTTVKSGIACKVAYDSNGLITGTNTLTETDLPKISIDKINGLSDLLDSKASIADINNIKKTLSDVHHHGDTVDTGCKVNIDNHGFVTSVSDLIAEDIPELPISKISGLQAVIDQLRSCSCAVTDTSGNMYRNVSGTGNTYKINPGTGCKITYDENGRVVGSSSLELDDIPMTLITRLNSVEANISSSASQVALGNLSRMVVGKLDANSQITPGVYTKVTVDSKGLITFGEKLTKSDIPNLSTGDIMGLPSALNEKANRSEINELSQTVSTLTSSMNKLGDVHNIQSLIAAKADKEDVLTIKNQLKELRALFDNIISNIPGDQIMEQLSIISSELDTLAGRVSQLEKEKIIP